MCTITIVSYDEAITLYGLIGHSLTIYYTYTTNFGLWHFLNIQLQYVTVSAKTGHVRTW